LLARDLNAALAADAQRRALHIRAMHRTWGVALGFQFEPVQDAREGTVGPGFGYDCRGRAIVSAEPTTVPAPANKSLSDLVVSATPAIRFDWREPGRACDDELVLTSPVYCRRRRFRLAAGVADVSLEKRIDVQTASGEFDDDPVYFATLEIDLRLAATLEVVDESSTQFSLVLRAPEADWTAAQGMDAHVHWTGVERLPACAIGDDQEEV
jgi:hypothetical protein